MESTNLANSYEDAFEEYEKGLMQSTRQGEISQSEIRANRFFWGLLFALPISLFMWVIIIWALL